MNRFLILTAWLVAISTMPNSGFVGAQVVSGLSAEDRPQVPETRFFQLHPEAASQPALKYRLLPKFIEQRQGNAAVYYGKVTADQSHFFGNHELQNQIVDLIEASLQEVRGSEIAAGAMPDNIYHQLRLAALCNSCDWQIPIHHERFFEILLPELQQTRHFARLLAVRARYQIANGKFDEAIETLQTGYAIARHDATGPTLIHTLVAISIQTIMDEQVEAFIQQPGAPNLYWALAALPNPLIDDRVGREAEQSIIELTFPELRDLTEEQADQYTPAFWRNRLVDLVSMAMMMSGDRSGPDAGTGDQPAAANAKAMLLAMSEYPIARRRMIERGVDANQVNKLSPSCVVVLDGVREFHRLNQETLKWTYLPYYDSLDGLDAAEDQLRDQLRDDPFQRLVQYMAPVAQPISAARVRAWRQRCVLQLLESIRMYAAENGGHVPEKLQDLTSAPAPRDPVTGQPFQFVRDAFAEASIRGPRLPAGPLNIKLKIVGE